MRDQEEDLLQADERRGPRRSYWVEHGGEWGLLLDDPFPDDSAADVHWVGDRLPEEVHPTLAAEAEQDSWCTTTHGDSEVHRNYQHGDWWTEDPEGGWWAWSDAKPWLDVNEAMVVDPDSGKEMSELLATFQDKVRTFKESRQLVAARNSARGFYPLNKGKSKGKGKGSYKGKSKKGARFTSTTSSPTSPSTALAADGSGKGGGQRPGSSSYTGCFICGGKDHDFRNCPKRSQGKGTAHFVSATSGIYMLQGSTDGTPGNTKDEQHVSVYAATGHESEDQMLCYMHVGQGDPEAGRPEGIIPEEALSVAGQLYPGFAVVDSGATETVGSLDALEAVVSMRRRQYGLENVQVFPEAKRNFRFGNGQQQRATSFVEVPQTLNGRAVALGVYALDVPRVPILLSIRTLKRLGSVIDFEKKTIVFKAIDPGVTIALHESASGHLLLDLVHDWLRQPGSSPKNFSGTVLSSVMSRYKESERDAGEPQTAASNQPGASNIQEPQQASQRQDPQGPEPEPQHFGASCCMPVVEVPCVEVQESKQTCVSRKQLSSDIPVYDMACGDDELSDQDGPMGSLSSFRDSPEHPLRRGRPQRYFSAAHRASSFDGSGFE